MNKDGRPLNAREIIELLQRLARGETPGLGRDEVAGAVRVETGGFHGRSLECRVEAVDGTYHLHSGAGDITIRMVEQGEFIFRHGDVTIDATNRVRGAAFVDAMADWLGLPTEVARSIDTDTAVAPISGTYARLAVRDDADGVRWHVNKLMLAGDTPCEMFFRIDEGSTRAALTEKWSEYRERLVVALDRAVGFGRSIAARTPVDVTGGVMLTVPLDWTVQRKSGSVRITDAADEAVFEISHQPYPIDPRLPPLRARLELALVDVADRDEAIARAVVRDRGDAELVWTEYVYEATDTKTGEKRDACCRLLLAANELLQVLVTYAYWPADAAWAVPEWERIISTLRLPGRGLVADAGIHRPR